jgi:hypothetical protein
MSRGDPRKDGPSGKKKGDEFIDNGDDVDK